MGSYPSKSEHTRPLPSRPTKPTRVRVVGSSPFATRLPITGKEVITNFQSFRDDTVVVDPAGLDHIEKNRPLDASHFSGALYKFRGMSDYAEDVLQHVTRVGDARYSERDGLIHAVGYDFKAFPGFCAKEEEAYGWLYITYLHIFQETQRAIAGGRTRLHIPPISGGTFAGRVDVPKLTAYVMSTLEREGAIPAGLTEILICIYKEKEFPDWEAHFDTFS